MKCLVLAAGHGSRLRAVSDSKPLALLAGVPLIEHVVRRAVAGGASGFVVVTGHQAERLESYLARLGDRLAVPIDCVRIDDWDRPNGHSVLAGAAVIDSDYLLTMSDHLVDPAIIAGLVADRQPADLILAVDRQIDGPLIDLDDATKVESGPNGRIVRIGKTLERFDAIDTGAFRATPALAAALRGVIADGGAGSLSEGVQRLADAGRAHTLDVGSAPWIDVDDARMLALAEHLLSSEAAQG